MPPSHWTEFGSLLRKKRRELELTQAQVATKAGIHEGQYARIEKGESGTRRDTVIALAKALDINRAFLLNKAGLAETNYPISDVEVERSKKILGAEGMVSVHRKPRDIGEFLTILESLGLEQFIFQLKGRDLSTFTEDDFQELLDRIKADVEITLKRKRG